MNTISVTFVIIALLYITSISATSKINPVEPKTWGLMRRHHLMDSDVRRMILARQNQVCPNSQYTCSAGYFCVDNTICLNGTVGQYSPIALITAGAVAQLIQDTVNVGCIIDIVDSVEDLISAFEDWQNGQYQNASNYLGSGISDVENGLYTCSGAGNWWDDVMNVIKTVVSVYAPEVVAAYEIIVEGVNIYEDFAGMMTDCSDQTQDYIDCGVNLGNLIDNIWNAVQKKK